MAAQAQGLPPAIDALLFPRLQAHFAVAGTFALEHGSPTNSDTLATLRTKYS